MTEGKTPYRAHPKAEEYRLMNESELSELGADIEENGQHEPIVYSAGPASPDLLIDGRNRLLACLRVRVSPSIEYRRFESEEEILAFIASKNDLRRHLTPEEQEKRREQRQARALQLRQEGKSYRQIGEALGVDPMTARADVLSSTVERSTVELPTRIKGADGKERPAQRSARLQSSPPNPERASQAPQTPQDPEPALLEASGLCPSSPVPKPTREALEAQRDQAPTNGSSARTPIAEKSWP